MRKLLFVILLCIVCFIPTANAARNITLPHTETFEGTAWLNDIRWVESGSQGDVTRVEASWRGAGNYCARLDPPRVAAAGGGTNGGVIALGAFYNSASATWQVAFALNVGTTYSGTAANAGGSLINKFIDIFNGSRVGLLGLNNRGSCSAHEFGILDANTEVYWYYPNLDGGGNCQGPFFRNGTGGSRDYAGRWIWLNYAVNNTTGVVVVRIWDRDGGYYTFQRSNASDGSVAELKTLGGYYNEYHPTADTNSRLLIDDLTISNSTSVIEPPSGFVGGGGDTTPPTVDNASVNGSTATINFNESVVSTNYVAGDFNLDCTNPTASNIALSSPSGSGSSLTFSLASPIVYGQSCNLDYLGRTNGIEDTSGNDLASFSDASISNTTPDTTAPTVSGALPTGEQECSSDPRNVTASVTTSENATCRYGWTSVPFGSMANFSTTGGTSHSTILSGLPCGSSYRLYVLCADSSANISSPITIADWSIASLYAPRGIVGTGIIKLGTIH